jgi:hypothetical protein
VILLIALAACRSPDPVPDDLSEPLVWLLGHLDGDEDEVAARADHVDAYIRGLPGDGPVEDRRFVPDTPDDAQLDRLPVPGAAGDLVGAAVVRRSAHDWDEHLELVAATPRPCLEGPGWTTWDRFISDGACLPEGACDDALAEDSAAGAWSASPVAARTQLRTLTLPDDREALVSRTWLQAPAADLDARYGVDLLVRDPFDARRTWRVGARWVRLLGGEATDVEARLLDELDLGPAAAEAWLDGPAGCLEEG